MARDKMYIVPHSHYDAAVFMTREETLEKVGYKNVLDVLNLLKKDDNYKFVLDQVAYIKPFLEEYPEQESFFKEMVKEKRLEITSGMYVMPDVNIPGGESLIRQILKGKEYCQEKLGVDVKCGWMIDTFGHHPQIPQIMKKCGFDYYVFGRGMKAGSPSEFYWQGIDGSKIFSHRVSYGGFYPVPNSLAQFRMFVKKKYQIIKRYAATSDILVLSGADLVPPEPHLSELIRQFNKEENEFELMLSTPSEFFDLLKKEKNLPVVGGDFNPIYQGCYSARIEVKQRNRFLENLLFSCEELMTLSWLLGARVREENLVKAWEPVLFNQFHDVICGCHTDKVYENTMLRYKYAKALADEQIEENIGFLIDKIDTKGEGIPIVVFNQLAWERTDVVECEVSFTEPEVFSLGLKNFTAAEIPVQIIEEERYSEGGLRTAKIIFVAEDVPSLGYEVYHLIPNHEIDLGTEVNSSKEDSDKDNKDIGILENEFYRLKIDLRNGAITSIKDKNNHWEVIDKNNKIGNTLTKELDRGDFWQYNGSVQGGGTTPRVELYPFPKPGEADFSHNYNGYGYANHGQVMAEFAITHPFATGSFSTRVRVYHKMPRIDITTSLINNEEWVRYRAAIPTSITNGGIVHEIPFGAVRRPEGEHPAQNWIDYSDGTKGVALLNQGLPGNNIVNGIMMLSLLKCTTYIEYPEIGGYEKGIPADGGFEKGKKHHFNYSIVPHKKDWREAKLYRRGWEFNNPLLVKKAGLHPGELPSKHSFLRLSKDNVVVTAFKKSGNDLAIRLYEAEGKRIEKVELWLKWRIDICFETDLIERNKKRIRAEGNSLCFGIEPFEIKTFRLKVLK